MRIHWIEGSLCNLSGQSGTQTFEVQEDKQPGTDRKHFKTCEVQSPKTSCTFRKRVAHVWKNISNIFGFSMFFGIYGMCNSKRVSSCTKSLLCNSIGVSSCTFQKSQKTLKIQKCLKCFPEMCNLFSGCPPEMCNVFWRLGCVVSGWVAGVLGCFRAA